ncbi:YoaK family protein [soil metagenome]
MRSRLRAHPDQLHLGLMLALTFTTGIVDAVGYLGLDRVFTGNMTGNVVILGMALTGADGLPIVGPIIALVCFMVGAAVAGRTLRNKPAGWHTRNTALFGVVGIILLVAAVPTLVVGERTDTLNFIVTGALGLAMGMQAGAARHIGVKDVTTVVVTSTLVGLAFDSRFGGGTGNQPWFRRAGAVVLIGAGAAVGALLIHVHVGLGMAVAAVITIAAAVLGHIGRPHPVAADL